jgi:hypothetical protein
MTHAIEAVQWMTIVPISVRGDFAGAVFASRSGGGTRAYCRNPALERSFNGSLAGPAAHAFGRFSPQEGYWNVVIFQAGLKKDG